MPNIEGAGGGPTPSERPPQVNPFFDNLAELFGLKPTGETTSTPPPSGDSITSSTEKKDTKTDVLPNNPALLPPSKNALAGSDALSAVRQNPWLKFDNRWAVLAIILRIFLFVMAQAKFKEGMLTAEQTEKGGEAGRGAAEAIRRKGQLAFLQGMIGGGLNLASAAGSVYAMSRTVGSTKQAELTKQKELDRVEKNPNYPTGTKETERSTNYTTAKAEVDRLNGIAPRTPQQERELVAAQKKMEENRPPYEIYKTAKAEADRLNGISPRTPQEEKELEAAQQKMQDYKPGVKDIEAIQGDTHYASKSDPEKAEFDSLKTEAQASIVQKKKNMEAAVTTESDQITRNAGYVENITRQLMQAGQEFNKGSFESLTAQEEAIRQLEDLILKLFDQGKSMSQESARQFNEDIINLLRFLKDSDTSQTQSIRFTVSG